MKFQVMDFSGHSTIDFDKADPAMLANAEKLFNELVGEKKMTAYEKTGPGEGKVVKKFDQAAETVVFRPMLVGG